MTKLEILKQLRENQKVQDAWVDSLPKDISTAFVDNDLVDSLYKSQELLMKATFGGAYEDASWFLNEFKIADDGHTQIKEADGTEWSFSDDLEFLAYFRKVCGE